MVTRVHIQLLEIEDSQSISSRHNFGTIGAEHVESFCQLAHSVCCGWCLLTRTRRHNSDTYDHGCPLLFYNFAAMRFAATLMFSI